MSQSEETIAYPEPSQALKMAAASILPDLRDASRFMMLKAYIRNAPETKRLNAYIKLFDIIATGDSIPTHTVEDQLKTGHWTQSRHLTPYSTDHMDPLMQMHANAELLNKWRLSLAEIMETNMDSHRANIRRALHRLEPVAEDIEAYVNACRAYTGQSFEPAQQVGFAR